MKARAYVTASTAETFEGKDEDDIIRKALKLFREDINDVGMKNWVKVELVIYSNLETNTKRDET